MMTESDGFLPSISNANTKGSDDENNTKLERFFNFGKDGLAFGNHDLSHANEPPNSRRQENLFNLLKRKKIKQPWLWFTVLLVAVIIITTVTVATLVIFQKRAAGQSDFSNQGFTVSNVSKAFAGNNYPLSYFPMDAEVSSYLTGRCSGFDTTTSSIRLAGSGSTDCLVGSLYSAAQFCTSANKCVGVAYHNYTPGAIYGTSFKFGVVYNAPVLAPGRSASYHYALNPINSFGTSQPSIGYWSAKYAKPSTLTPAGTLFDAELFCYNSQSCAGFSTSTKALSTSSSTAMSSYIWYTNVPQNQAGYLYSTSGVLLGSTVYKVDPPNNAFCNATYVQFPAISTLQAACKANSTCKNIIIATDQSYGCLLTGVPSTTFNSTQLTYYYPNIWPQPLYNGNALKPFSQVYNVTYNASDPWSGNSSMVFSTRWSAQTACVAISYCMGYMSNHPNGTSFYLVSVSPSRSTSSALTFFANPNYIGVISNQEMSTGVSTSLPVAGGYYRRPWGTQIMAQAYPLLSSGASAQVFNTLDAAKDACSKSSTCVGFFESGSAYQAGSYGQSSVSYILQDAVVINSPGPSTQYLSSAFWSKPPLIITDSLKFSLPGTGYVPIGSVQDTVYSSSFMAVDYFRMDDRVACAPFNVPGYTGLNDSSLGTLLDGLAVDLATQVVATLSGSPNLGTSFSSYTTYSFAATGTTFNLRNVALSGVGYTSFNYMKANSYLLSSSGYAVDYAPNLVFGSPDGDTNYVEVDSFLQTSNLGLTATLYGQLYNHPMHWMMLLQTFQSALRSTVQLVNLPFDYLDSNNMYSGSGLDSQKSADFCYTDVFDYQENGWGRCSSACNGNTNRTGNGKAFWPYIALPDTIQMSWSGLMSSPFYIKLYVNPGNGQSNAKVYDIPPPQAISPPVIAGCSASIGMASAVLSLAAVVCPVCEPFVGILDIVAAGLSIGQSTQNC